MMPTRMNFRLCHLTFILSKVVNQTIKCQNCLRMAALHYDCTRADVLLFCDQRITL